MFNPEASGLEKAGRVVLITVPGFALLIAMLYVARFLLAGSPGEPAPSVPSAGLMPSWAWWPLVGLAILGAGAILLGTVRRRLQDSVHSSGSDRTRRIDGPASRSSWTARTTGQLEGVAERAALLARCDAVFAEYGELQSDIGAVIENQVIFNMKFTEGRELSQAMIAFQDVDREHSALSRLRAVERDLREAWALAKQRSAEVGIDALGGPEKVEKGRLAARLAAKAADPSTGERERAAFWAKVKVLMDTLNLTVPKPLQAAIEASAAPAIGR